MVLGSHRPSSKLTGGWQNSFPSSCRTFPFELLAGDHSRLPAIPCHVAPTGNSQCRCLLSSSLQSTSHALTPPPALEESSASQVSDVWTEI